MRIQIPVACAKDCAGGCPLLAHVEDGRLIKIGNNPAGSPYMAGCVKGFQMVRALYAPDRLRKPLRRVGRRGDGQFREMEWPAALDLVAEKLVAIRDRYGNAAIMEMGGSGSCTAALHNTHVLMRRFLHMFGGCTTLRSNYSAAASNFALDFMLGTRETGLDPATLLHSRLIILWGANICDNRFGCEMEAYLREAKRRGTPIIVIDPRHTTTARELGSQWIPIRPATDSALMMALLYVLIREELVDWAFVEKYSVGFDALRRRVLGEEGGEPCTPAWAEWLCGVPAEAIWTLGRQYGHARPAALLPGLSIQRTSGGEEAARLAVALQVATGNLGRLGGSSGVRTPDGLPTPRVGKMKAPANPIPASVPILRWPDAILEGTAGGYPSDIKAIYNVGGNFIVQGCDVHKSIRAFEQVEFAITHDYFLTPTARYCDIVLPATTFLEREDIVFPTAGNYVLFSNRAVAPLSEAKNDYDIFCELAGRLGFVEAFSEGKDEEGWLRSFVAGSDVPDYEEFKRTGIYLAPDQLRVGLANFVADPSAYPLPTPSGKIQIVSEPYAATGGPAIPTPRLPPARPPFPLQLITPKSRYRIHSQYSNIPWFRAREKHALWMHPADATARGIEDSQLILVHNEQGRIRIRARVTEEIMPGVVCLLAGIWPELLPDGTDVAGSANVLTNTEGTRPSYGTTTHSVWVEVEPAAG